MEKDFKNLKQGSCTVQENENEYSRIVSCLLSVVRSEWDKTRCFEWGLRPSIYAKVRLLNITTYRVMVDRSLLVEQGEAVVRQQCKAYEKEKGKEKKIQPGGSGGQSSSKWPPKHPCQQLHSRESRQPTILEK